MNMMGRPAGKTLGSRIDFMPVAGWHWKFLMVCMLGVTIENFDQIVIALAMPVIAQSWHLPPFQIGVLLSGSSLGLLIGASVFGVLSDMIGRRKVFVITTIIYSVFVGLSALSQDFRQLYILRVLAGLGLGGFVPVASAYVSEFAPVKVRGRFMGIWSIGNGIGYCAAVVASMYFITVTVPDGWRWVFGIGASGLLLIPFVYMWLPESVRWLQGKGKIAEAVNAVEEIEMKSLGALTVPHEEAMQLAQQASQGQGGAGKSGLSALFTQDLLKSSVLAALLWFVSGYTFFGFIFWMPMFLVKNMGYSLASGYSFTLIAALVGTGTPGLTVGYLSDYIGRRPTLTMCMVGYALAGVLFLYSGGWWILPLYWFSSAMGSQLYIYSPELFPGRLRGSGLGFASSIGRIAGFVAPILIGMSVEAWGLAGVIYVNGAMLLVGVAATWLLGKETRVVTAPGAVAK